MSYKEGIFETITDEKKGEGWILYTLKFDNDTTKAFNNLKSKNTKQVDELIPGVKYKYMYNDEKKTAYGFWESKDNGKGSNTQIKPSRETVDETNSEHMLPHIFMDYVDKYLEGTSPEERSIYHFITVYFNTKHKEEVEHLVRLYENEIERMDRNI